MGVHGKYIEVKQTIDAHMDSELTYTVYENVKDQHSLSIN